LIIDQAPHLRGSRISAISCYTPPMDDRHPDKKRARQDRRLDEALKETFPASDPVAIQQVDAPNDPQPPKPQSEPPPKP
jgi:hypothetical protein